MEVIKNRKLFLTALRPWFNKPQNNHLEMSKNTVNRSFMILIKINKVCNFKGLLVLGLSGP